MGLGSCYVAVVAGGAVDVAVAGRRGLMDLEILKVGIAVHVEVGTDCTEGIHFGSSAAVGTAEDIVAAENIAGNTVAAEGIDGVVDMAVGS